MDVEKAIREYLPNVVHMSLATCVDNKPWICEVHVVYDDELNFYFRSKLSSRHSQEIAQNPNVSGNIVEQHVAGQNVRGVYFEGTAAILEDVDASHVAYKLFNERFNKDESILDDANQADGTKFYKITVENHYLFYSRETPSGKYKLK